MDMKPKKLDFVTNLNSINSINNLKNVMEIHVRLVCVVHNFLNIVCGVYI